ncbi:MAG: Na+/H+ antiporter subunit G [Rhodobacteraceae bacterium]|nr:Na+/H+ antiporter subunit G [Paracoccaceae bacterium]
MNPVLEFVIAAMLVVGGIFGLVGSFGLVKLPDTMMRLHAPTKATTLGVGGVLIASMGYEYATTGTMTLHELLVTLFLFLTAPITAHFVAKAYLHRSLRPRDLPETGTARGWATYDGTDEEDKPGQAPRD